MASNKRKQDEKHLKMLREMVALPSNKTCFDCHQRGPTYVNMTIGSFVCTSCSGILRGLNPPHRVKSISMASFTPEEMDFLKAHGNDLNRKVYLGLYDNRTWPEPDSRDEQRVRDFMVQKYENKRFFVAPTEAMRDEARRMNEAALSKQSQTKPLRALLGENATKLVVGNHQTSHATHNHTPATSNMAAPVKSSLPPPVTAPVTAQQAPAKPPASSGFDLLGDLGSDPFASSAPATASSNAGGFADFSNFGSSSVSAPAQPTQPVAQPAAPAAFPPLSSAPLQPFSGGGGGLQPQPAGAPNTAPPTSTPTANNATNFSAISDKYAALADLDSTFHSPTTQSTTVNWGGSDSVTGTGIGTNVGSGSGLNWGGSDPNTGSQMNWGGAGSTGSGDGGSVSWGGQPANSAGGVGWNSQGGATGMGVPPTSVGGASLFGGATSSDSWQHSAALGKPGNPFMAHAGAANPFGASSTPAMSQGGQPNPFGGTPNAAFGQPTPGTGFGQAPVSSAGFGQPPASNAAGFGFQQQFPVQNGGFGMNASAGAGFGNFGAVPPSTAPPSYGAAQQQGFQSQAGGFGMQQQPQGFPAQQGFGGAGWGQMGVPQQQQQPSTANPFMVGTQQSPAASNTGGGGSNPFGQL